MPLKALSSIRPTDLVVQCFLLKESDKMLTEKEVGIVKQLLQIEILYLEEQVSGRQGEGAYVTEIRKRASELKAILTKLSSKKESNVL